jgi:hypothetical protein
MAKDKGHNCEKVHPNKTHAEWAEWVVGKLNKKKDSIIKNTSKKVLSTLRKIKKSQSPSYERKPYKYGGKINNKGTSGGRHQHD